MIVTSEQTVGATIDALTDGKGADVRFDPVTGPQPYKLTGSLAPRGRVVIYGALVPEDTQIPVFAVLGKQLRLEGYELFEITRDETQLREAIRFVLDGLESKAIAPSWTERSRWPGSAPRTSTWSPTPSWVRSC